VLKLFVHYVLGGRSGKREAAWFMWIVVTGMVAFVVFCEYRGVAMPLAQSILIIVWPLAFAGVLAAHGIEHYGGKDLLNNRKITIESPPSGQQAPVPEMSLDGGGRVG